MKPLKGLATVVLLVLVSLTAVIPCGPGYVSPLFDTNKGPEEPFKEYAAGKLGIVKNSYRRAVLYAAYRYIAGSGMNASEQQGLIDAWKADFENKDFADRAIDDAVKAWVAKRAQVVGKEEKVPEIYAERSYGGYEFFPNCTKNAFETATETLSDRASSHGPSDGSVRDWVSAQDQVFLNCSTGKRSPADAPPGAPDWLQKDRAYQKAAAEFYSLDYDGAKRDFAAIAADNSSPWAETAGYLVGRTLIRQASTTKSKERATALYDEAEKQLDKFAGSSKLADSANRMIALVKYRNRPKERVRELARILAGYGQNDDFRQSVIDYDWLLDKFESEITSAEAKRKAEAERTKGTPEDEALRSRVLNQISSFDENLTVEVKAGEVTVSGDVDKEKVGPILQAVNEAGAKKVVNKLTSYGRTEESREGFITVNVYFDDGGKTFYIKPDATDDEIVAEAQKTFPKPLSDEQKKAVLSSAESAYGSWYSESTRKDYEGGYYDGDAMTPELLPDFLKDDLSEWLMVYQMPDESSYQYSFDKFKGGNGDLWLMTAISKADTNSPGVNELIEAAKNANRTSPAFTTISFHAAEILIAQNKQAEARKLIEENLALGDNIPISVLNSFLQLKLRLATTMEDWITSSLRKPYAFDFDGSRGTVEDFIAEQKSWYDPTNEEKQTREAYDAEVESRFVNERLWETRLMFDSDVIEAINNYFPTAKMIDFENSPALPDYMRERMAMAIWTRAYVTGDTATLLKVTPDLAKRHPELADGLAAITAAKTPAARNTAILYFVLKNPILSPFVQDGAGKDDNEQEQWDMDDWWCEPYYDEETGKGYDAFGNEVEPLPKPPFLTAAQIAAAKAEQTKLKAAGDAPHFLAAKVFTWQQLYPADKRVPEALYIIWEANGWTKYGCGNSEELQKQAADLLTTKYAASDWTKKMLKEQTENQ